MRASQTLTEKLINEKLENSIFKYKFFFAWLLITTSFFSVKHHYVLRQIFRKIYAYSKFPKF